jgi:hypothetical protein
MNRLRHHPWVGVLVLVTCVGAAPSMRHASAVAEDLPSELSDQAYWQLITDLSEPGGYFRSDNFLSNEIAFQTVIPELKANLPTGGVYFGVGPEQNFTYLVALKPKLAFVIDIRRQNLIEQLLYKAFIELSANRVEFLSRLFARQAPADVPIDASVEGLFAAFDKVEASDDLFQMNLRAATDHLVRHHKFALSPEDVKGLEYVYTAFYRGGPGLNYSFSTGGPSVGFGFGFPTYVELMTETDNEGEHRSYLASDDAFQLLKTYEMKNALVPLVGDFAGEKALRAAGQYVKEHGATVTAFYTSNVEQYLFQDADAWKRFLANVATFPFDAKSTFIRSIPNRGFVVQTARAQPPTARAFTALASISDVVNAFNEGKVQTYGDVIAMSH